MLTQKKTKAIMLGDTPVKKVMFRDKQIWPEEPTITPLNFTAEEANSTVALNKIGEPTAVNLETSTDGVTWIDYTIGSAITLSNIGDKVYMRNKSETDTCFSIDGSKYYQFAMTGKIGASGDITSLLNKNGTTTLCEDCFYELFGGCASLTTTPELSATTLANGCYSGMFDGCTNLTTPPELPATTLDASCYRDMFSGCTSLTTVPELPATTLADSCYSYMFYNCTNLTTPPELPATTLADGCYQGMFLQSGLITAPALPATTLADSCYSYMFAISPNLTTPPKLPATTLARECYYRMFFRSSNIKLSTTQTGEYQTPYRIPTTGTGTDALDALWEMFIGTGGTFTGTPEINTTYYLSNGSSALLSYEEIKALGLQSSEDVIAELNTNALGYYQKFNSEGKIYAQSATKNYLSEDGTYAGMLATFDGIYAVVYNGTLWTYG